MGKLELGSAGCFASFYFIALPLAYFFAFVMNWGVFGLWYGIVAGLTFLVSFY